MRRKSKLPELLAPAGDFEALLAAVSAGADAVYLGGRAFGARAYAKNFDLDEIERAVEYCHLYGVKLYVTVNTLVFDKEMRELSDYAAKLWEVGVDALIITDLGAIREIKRRVPNMELHASTQMSVHSADGARMAAALGCSRVVLARELSYENIRAATEGSPIETEVFLHGALCVCHSGQCLFSSLVGGRSGNRGECAQPCKRPFGDGYPLSLSDLSLASHIEELIAILSEIMYGVGIIPHNTEVGGGTLHRGKTAHRFRRIGDTRGVAVLRHAPYTLYGRIQGKALHLVHIGAVFGHFDGDHLYTKRLTDAEVAVIAGGRAKEDHALLAYPRTGGIAGAVQHRACNGIVHQVQAGVAANDDVLGGDARQL